MSPRDNAPTAARTAPRATGGVGLRVSLVGPGRVGRSLYGWALAAGAEPARIVGKTTQHAADYARRTGAEAVALDTASTGDDDLLLIAVPDDALDTVARTLSRRRQAKVALHTSGSVGAEALVALRAAGCAIGSLHPLRAFAEEVPAARAGGTFFACDGDAAAVDLSERLAAAWRGRAEPVASADRLLYHFAATLAAGGTVTLLALADRLGRRIGLSPAAVDAYRRLAIGALADIPEGGDPAAAITGPIARGEAELVERQLAALEDAAPSLLPLVAHLGLETLRCRREASPEPGAAERIRRSLQRRARIESERR